MAQSKISIIIEAIDKSTKVLRNSGDKISGRAKQNEATFKKMAVWWWVAFGAIVAGSKQLVEAYQGQERAEARLNQIASQVTWANEKQIQSFKNLASELQKTWVVWDEVIISGQSQIASFTKSSEAVAELSDDLADLAVATYWSNVSQEQAIQTANLMGKALNGQLWALSKSGILISDEYAKAFEEANTEHERAVVLSNIIQDNYGGMNQAMRETSEWGIQAMKNSFWDMMEIVGAGLVPAMNNLVWAIEPIIEKVATRVEQNPTLSTNLILVAGWVTGLVAVLGTLWLVIPSVIWWVTALGTAFTFLTANPIGMTIVAITALVAGGIWLVKNWDEVKAKLMEIWTAVSWFLSDTREAMTTRLKDQTDEMKTYLSDSWNSIKENFSTKLDEIKTYMSDSWNAIKENITTKTTEIKNNLTDWLESILTNITEKLTAVRDFFKDTRTKIKDALSTAWDIIKEITSVAMRAMLAVITLGWSETLAFIISNWDSIKVGIQTALWAIKQNVIDFIEKLKSVWSAWLENVRAVVGTVAGAIQGAFSDAFGAIKSSASSAIDWVSNKIQGLMDFARRAKEAVSNALSFWSSAWADTSWNRAVWGTVYAGQTYKIWELGPETFTPLVNGTITPNGKGGWLVVNTNISGVTISNGMDMSKFKREVESIFVNAVKKQNLWYT